MNILFVCTSNKDRSPALERHFRERYPQHEYRSAGINRHFTEKHGTHLLAREDMEWSGLVVFSDYLHYNTASERFPDPQNRYLSPKVILNLGDYDKDNMQQYVLDAEKKILEEFPEVFKEKTWLEKEEGRFVKNLQKEAQLHVALGECDVQKLLEEVKNAPLEMVDMSHPIRNTSPQELLEAAIRHYSKNIPEAEQWMRLGFALAQDDGWENVAPAWLKEEPEEDTFKFDITKPRYGLQ